MEYRIMLTLETGEVARHETSPDFASYDDACSYIEDNNLEGQHPECQIFVEEVPSSHSHWAIC